MYRLLLILCGLLGMQICGCAVVDPKPDYQRVAQQVSKVTNQGNLYMPGQDDAIPDRVNDLLDGGLTMAEAIEIGLLNNPSLQADFCSIGMAHADVVQAGMLTNPSLSASLGFPSSGGLASLGLGLGYNIGELWIINARKQGSQRQLDHTVLKVARRATDLVADIKAAYIAAVAASEQQATRAENVTLARDLLNMALEGEKAGTTSGLDVNLARSVLLEAELEQSRERLAASDALRELATLLGITGQAGSLTLLDPVPTVETDLPQAEELVELACVYCLDLQAARMKMQQAESHLQQEKRRFLSAIEIGLEAEREERRREGGRDILADTVRSSVAAGQLAAPEFQPKSERDQHQSWTVGPSISLELPIFDQNQARIAKAQYEYDQAAKMVDALTRAASQEVRGAVDKVLTTNDLARLYRDESIPLAEENLNLSNRAYAAGQAPFLVVLEAQRILLTSRSQAVDAQKAAATAVVDMERTMCLPFTALAEKARQNVINESHLKEQSDE